MEKHQRIFDTEVRVIDKEKRIAQFVISTNDKDRHGTVLNMDNWDIKDYNRNPIVGYQHEVYGGGFCNSADPDQVIGKSRVFIEGDDDRANGEGKKLVGEVQFESKATTGNELAEKIWRKIEFGSLKATSVGFVPKKNKEGKTGSYGRELDGKMVDTDTFFYHGQELLEFSIVNIPSNPKALKRSLKNQTSNALLFIKERLGRSFAEIEEMKVSDVLRMIDGSEEDQGQQQEKITKPEETQPDTQSVFEYKTMLNKNKMSL